MFLTLLILTLSQEILKLHIWMILLWNWEYRVVRQGFMYFFSFFLAPYSQTVTDWNCKAVFVLARRRNAPAQRVYQGEKILTANSCTLVVLLLFTLVWYRQQSPSTTIVNPQPYWQPHCSSVQGSISSLWCLLFSLFYQSAFCRQII